jgi:hypothetical protein
MAPQLAEFELRYESGNYDIAAKVLLEIDQDYLLPWGHYRYTLGLHARLEGYLTDPRMIAASMTIMGMCHNLVGSIPRAITFYGQALAIYREIGDREGEATVLGGLGNRYGDIGQISGAIDLYEQALTIHRQFGDRKGIAANLTNLGNRYCDLGQASRAMDLYEEALAIARELGNRRFEAAIMDSIGNAHTDLRNWKLAIHNYRQSIEIAEQIGNAQTLGEARLGLARTCLFADDLPTALQAVETARGRPWPPTQAGLPLVAGLVHVLRGEVTVAAGAFNEAIADANERLQHTPSDFGALDIKGLALTGLTMISPTHDAAQAMAAFRAARNLTTAFGIVTRVLRLFDIMDRTDRTGRIHDLRSVAAGLDRQPRSAGAGCSGNGGSGMFG